MTHYGTLSFRCPTSESMYDGLPLEDGMVVKVNEKSVAAEPMNVGFARQRLLTRNAWTPVDVLLDRLTLAAGVSTRFEPSAKSLAWLHLLAGEASLETPQYLKSLSDT